MKFCIKCGLSKETTKFYRDKSRKDGLESYCKDCVKLKQIKYRHDNKEKDLARKNKWRRDAYKRDPDAFLSYQRAYYKKNPLPYLQNMARRRSMPFTSEALEYIMLIKNDLCVYCGQVSEAIDHIKPISKGGTGDWNNLAPVCKSCNSSKNAKDLLQFLLYRSEVSK